jgi:hypothetical protein
MRFVILALALVLLVALLNQWWKLARATRLFRKMHGAERKDLLIVYSASPHWQSYIESQWLPRWGERAVLLNRSEPNWKARPEAALWRGFTGPLEHTPSAIVVPAKGWPRVIRFYSAFKDLKRGNATTVHEKERDVEHALLKSRRADAPPRER